MTPKARNGPLEQMRILLVARRSARQQRIQTLNQLLGADSRLGELHELIDVEQSAVSRQETVHVEGDLGKLTSTGLPTDP